MKKGFTACFIHPGSGINYYGIRIMIGKHKKELEQLPDEMKHEINKCMEIYRELEKYDKGKTDIKTLHDRLGNILEKYEI
ncbi:hypothetical protein ED312_01775 [Sinomicrobium pectinilyticum]|uniref:Uncharacterized protein n=1 Tax=Sinomicrobium pectinilyticum TaxID=1084421 RepID=A0A3N0F1I1_SINP1|nr:hypothetical protein [Sinomicrobium pectinilyticum]RNL94013.1 hypothetical protein ED312_01775 [Sinomicrobium pectinilyticum]